MSRAQTFARDLANPSPWAAWRNADLIRFNSYSAMIAEVGVRSAKLAHAWAKPAQIEACQDRAKTGWKQALDAIVTLQADLPNPKIEKRITPYSWTGNNLSMGRLILGKKPMRRPATKIEEASKFARICLVNEALQGVGEFQFCQQIAKFIGICQQALAQGKRLEIWIGMGGYCGVFPGQGSKALISLTRVKEFNSAMNLQEISACGHPDTLRILQFGLEQSWAGGSPGMAPVCDRASYGLALAKLGGMPQGCPIFIVRDLDCGISELEAYLEKGGKGK